MFLEVPDGLLRVADGAVLVAAHAPHIFQSVHAAKGRDVLLAERRLHSFDARDVAASVVRHPVLDSRLLLQLQKTRSATVHAKHQRD